jgi:hypothetical protein
MKNLDPNHFELAWHGFLHGIPKISNNDEFRYLNLDEAMSVFKNMFSMAEDVGLKEKMKPIFRPPAFWLSRESFCACMENGIKILALSPYMQYNGQDIMFGKSAKVIYLDSLPPIYPLVKKNKLSIVYHASMWSKNILDDDRSKELVNFVRMNSENGSEFVFMEDF